MRLTYIHCKCETGTLREYLKDVCTCIFNMMRDQNGKTRLHKGTSGDLVSRRGSAGTGYKTEYLEKS